nr:fimbrial protein [Bacteriovorax sp. HI3]
MKTIISSLLFSILFSFSAFSAVTGSSLLQGKVSSRVSIEVFPEMIAGALDLSTTQTDLKVASYREKSNAILSGYRVRISSANLGKLKRIDGAEVFPYSLKYDGTTLNLSTSSGTTYERWHIFPVSLLRNLTISYTGKPLEQMVTGTYTDTITFEIAAR